MTLTVSEAEVVRTADAGPYLRLVIEGREARLGQQLKSLGRCNLVYLGEGFDDLAPARDIEVEGHTVHVEAGYTDDPVVLSLFWDFVFGVDKLGSLPIPDPSDPYVSAPRERVDDDDRVAAREIGLRTFYGRNVIPMWVEWAEATKNLFRGHKGAWAFVDGFPVFVREDRRVHVTGPDTAPRFFDPQDEGFMEELLSLMDIVITEADEGVVVSSHLAPDLIAHVDGDIARLIHRDGRVIVHRAAEGIPVPIAAAMLVQYHGRGIMAL